MEGSSETMKQRMEVENGKGHRSHVCSHKLINVRNVEMRVPHVPNFPVLHRLPKGYAESNMMCKPTALQEEQLKTDVTKAT